MFVLRIGWRVSIDARLLTLRSVLFTLTGRTGSIHMMLTWSDAVGLAACQTHRQFQFRFSIPQSYKPILAHTYQLWSHTGLLLQALSLPRNPKQLRETHHNSCIHRKINKNSTGVVQCPLKRHLFYCIDTNPMPHSSQQDSRSSAEICRETLPPLWIHNLSDIASTAPKACGKLKKGALVWE